MEVRMRLDRRELDASVVYGQKPYFPRAGVPQDQSAETSEGYGCGRFELCRGSTRRSLDPAQTRRRRVALFAMGQLLCPALYE